MLTPITPDLVLGYEFQFCQKKMWEVCLLNVRRIFKLYVCLTNVNDDTLVQM